MPERRPLVTAERAPGTLIEGPPGYDFTRAMACLDSESVLSSTHTRHGLTRESPLLFALVYLPHCLRSKETGGRMSFSEFHLDLAQSAKRWMNHDLGIGEVRDAWIAPRSAAKSEWMFKILPLWALAFGHREFIMAFSNAGKMARRFLLGVRKELKQNEWLRADFPELCTPVVDNGEQYTAKSGVSFVAAGMDASTNGMKVGSRRPDCLLYDDIEPKGADYDSTTKAKRLAGVTDTQAMAENAVVQWAATTTAHGSLAHDLVKAATGQEVADWVVEQKFRVHYYRAIIEENGIERSLWPQRWSLAELQDMRANRSLHYQLNYDNMPVSETGTFWTPEHFHMAPVNFMGDVGVLSIDPAVQNRATSDYSGMAVLRRDLPGNRVCLMDARQIKVSPDGLAATMSQVLRANPWIDTVLLERNNGGQAWRSILGRDLPAHVKLKTYWSSAAKPVRYADALDFWARGKVLHRTNIPAFESQALGYPGGVHDDVLDAVTAGVLYYLGEMNTE